MSNPAEQAARILRLGHDHGEALGEVVHALVSKAEKGAEDHGILNLADDRRDFYDEAIAELQDSIWYTAFQIVRLRRLQRSQRRPMDAEWSLDPSERGF